MSVVILLLTGDIFSLSCFLKARQETRTSHQQDLNNHHFLSSEETESRRLDFQNQLHGTE